MSSTNRPPLPFEDVNLLTALQHTVWYMPSVNSCVAMHDLLRRSHNTFFRDYRVVVAAGSGAGMGEKALRPVEEAIGNVPQDSKSITLSCGKLMTGVTVPAWAGIFMLRELKSPESYFQAAFRVQSPWAYEYVDTEGGTKEAVVKEHCYVLDFSPNRALRLIVESPPNSARRQLLTLMKKPRSKSSWSSSRCSRLPATMSISRPVTSSTI